MRPSSSLFLLLHRGIAAGERQTASAPLGEHQALGVTRAANKTPWGLGQALRSRL